MSLTAALKKGLSAAGSSGEAGDDWDPYPEQGSAAPAGKRANAAVVKSPARPQAQSGSQSSGKPVQKAAAKADPRRAAGLRSVEGGARPAAKTAARSAPKAAVADSLPARRPANQSEPSGKRANWLGTTAVPVGHVNPQQYTRELDRLIQDESRRAVADTLMDVRSAEIEGVAKLAGRIKARYLAKLLDVGDQSKPGVQETEIKELMRYRETFEELGRGLDMLKTAIETGDVVVSGMIRR